MKKRHIIPILAILIVLAGSDIRAEQTQTDMSVSVVILPVFKLSVDNANISFGYVEPGKTVELYPDRNFNEVVCVSNKGNKWYLKLSIMGDIIGPQNSKVGPDCFKWKVDGSTGDGILQEGWNAFKDQPVIAYTSGDMDTKGPDVVVRLKYKLDLPGNAIGGNYSVKILYTMTDIP